MYQQTKKALNVFIVLIAVLGCLLFAQKAFANQSQVNQYSANYFKQTKENILTLPSGTILIATPNFELSSSRVKKGQRVYATLQEDVYHNSFLLAPAGSKVKGFIMRVKKAGRFKGDGFLGLKFKQILTPQGQNIPIYAVINTEGGIVENDDMGREIMGTLGDTVVGAGLGVLTGGIPGLITGGIAGLGASSSWKGDDVVIPANFPMELKLLKPVYFKLSPKEMATL